MLLGFVFAGILPCVSMTCEVKKFQERLSIFLWLDHVRVMGQNETIASLQSLGHGIGRTV
jgi:hypothetical protein